MANHDASVKGFEEVFKTINTPHYNFVKDSPSAREIIKLLKALGDLYFINKKQINKELLQGRYTPKKLRKWMMETESLESQVEDILLLGGLSNSIEDEKLVEMGTKIINHLKHCPLVGELVYKKPITLTRMTDNSGLNQPLAGIKKKSTHISEERRSLFTHNEEGLKPFQGKSVPGVDFMKKSNVNVELDYKSDSFPSNDFFSASILELGNEKTSSSGIGNILEEAFSDEPDALVAENTPLDLYFASSSKLHSKQRSKVKIEDEFTSVDEKTKISRSFTQQEAELGKPNASSKVKIEDEVTTADEKTKISRSFTHQKVELGKLNENMLISASGFDPKQEGESSTCRKTAQLELELTFSTGAEEISVEQNEAEADNLHSSHKPYLDDTSNGITISVTGEMSKFVDLNLILRTCSSQEMQRLLNTGLSFTDLVPKMEDYMFLVKKKFDHQLSGPLESALVISGGLIPEHMILNKDICGTNEVAASDKWGHVCIVNFIEENFASLPDNPDCPNLVLLFLQRNNHLSSIPSSFFHNMPALCFLDLSNTRIRTLPSSLFTLTRLEVLMLRNCVFLDNLPSEISKLEHMEVLDLSGTELIDLPKEIGQLTRLRHLLLSFYGPDDESEYVHLPSELLCHGIISKLKALQALSIVVHPEDHRWTTIASNIVQEVGMLKMLGYLEIYFPKVEDLNLFIERSPSWHKKILTKYKFVVGNDVKRIVSRIPDGLESNYDQLDQCLRFVNGDEVNVIKKVLAHVTAFYLDHHIEIQSLSEFGIFSFKNLKFLVVRECPKVEVIIDEEISESAFPNLEHLRIHYLWKLEQIWKSPVPPGSFRALKYLIVHMCPQLQFVLSESMLQCLFNLEEFVVEDCEAVTILIEQGKEKVQHDAVKLPQLRKLILRYLPQLVTLGIDLHLSEEQISVYGCPSLILNSTPKKRKQRKLLSLCSVCI